MSSLRVAYFVNQYPKISHTFIRREILALERQGVRVQRLALRGWDGELADPEDISERSRTQYILQGGIVGPLLDALKLAVLDPVRFLCGLRLALKMSIKAERPWPYHLVYLAEACRTVLWLRLYGASHIHAHFGTNSTEVVMLASALSGVPYSFTAHGCEEFDKPEFIGLAEKVRRSAFVVAISSFARAQLYRWVEHPAWGKVNVVHCALDPAFRAVAPTPVPELPRLVCVGRLCKEKGLPLLIEAASLLAQKGIAFELVLAGDGEMRAELDAMIAARGLRRQVRITGWVSSERVREELLAARALVLASFAEGLPVVIMEAMAMARPVIATHIAGIPELIRPGDSGWLVPPGSVADLAAAMEQCVLLPTAELERMGMRARTRVMERHDDERETAKLHALFRKTACMPVAAIHAEECSG